MATGKRFYWIKLKKDFLTSDAIEFLMSNDRGSDYVVLYLQLCTATINTSGRLESRIGEMIVPFDVDRIQREGRYFPRETVVKALDIYKRIGLIYEDRNGTLIIADYDDMVGSETDWAIKKRREKNRESGGESDGENSGEIFPTENRHKSTEYRDKSLEYREQIQKDKDKDDDDDCAELSDDTSAPPPLPDPIAYQDGKMSMTLREYLSSIPWVTNRTWEMIQRFRAEMPDSLIRFAFDQTCEHGVDFPDQYTLHILENYAAKGFKTEADAEDYETWRAEHLEQ